MTAGEVPCHTDRAPTGTCKSRRHIRHPFPAAAAHRSTGQGTASGRRTASDRRMLSGPRTASVPHTTGARHTAFCRRMGVSGHQTASGRHTVADPGRETGAEGSAHLAEQDSHSGQALLGANSSGLIDTSDLRSNLSPGIEDPVDMTTGRGPGRLGSPLEAEPRRLGLRREGASGRRPQQQEADSACLRDCLVVGPLFLSGTHLPCCN
jgi:hypothetical protein